MSPIFGKKSPSDSQNENSDDHKDRASMDINLNRQDSSQPPSARPSLPRGLPRDNATNGMQTGNDNTDHDDSLSPIANKPMINHGQSHIDDNEHPVFKKIAEQERLLKARYPQGGVRARRVITTEILINTPPKFFEKYHEFVQEATQKVKIAVNERGRSDDLSRVLDDPANNALQEDIYYFIDGLISTEMEAAPFMKKVERSIVRTLILDEVIGFGPIDPLWRDKNVDEIIIHGPNSVKVEIKGELKRVPGVYFSDHFHVEDLLETKIFKNSNKKPSQSTPMVKSNLPDKSRVFVTHRAVSPDGPNINIRKHPERYWAPEDMVRFGSSSEEMMTYIGNLIYKGASCLVVGGTHSGKAVTLDTLINTVDGQKSMREIQVGDVVFDHNGITGAVTDKFPQPERQVYALVLSNREVTFCDIEHNWFVHDTHEGTQKVMTTGELIDAGVTNDGRFVIPHLSSPVTYDSMDNELETHPYKKGLALGYTSSIPDFLSTLPSQDNEFRSKLVSHGVIEENGEIAQLREVARQYVGPSLIEDSYKFSSIHNRRMLLAGLVDAIGYIDYSTATWNLSVCSEDLAQDINLLASSLGMCVQVSAEKTVDYVHEGMRVVDQKMWDVMITSRESLGLRSHWSKMVEDFEMYEEEISENETLSIISVAPVEDRVEEMACISVDTPDRTYTVGNGFTTTHNTTLLNAFTGFYKENVNIVTMEDNIEMKVNPRKMKAAALQTRPVSEDGSKATNVTMTDLVKASTQMRPDVIIVGEVTGTEALDLLEVLNTGHAGSSTIHANSAQAAVPRAVMLATRTDLVNREAALEMFSQAFDFIVVTKYSTIDGSRRIVNVSEVGREVKFVDGRLSLETRTLWDFQDHGLDENGKIQGSWVQKGELSPERIREKQLGIERDLTWEQLKQISSVPEEYQPKNED